MPGHQNLVHQVATTTGTGNFTVAALNGKRTFSAAFGTGSGNKFDYFISNRGAAEWERGIGYMSNATTLVRETVLESSNSNSAVNFSAGAKDVAHDIPAGEQMRGPSSATSGAAARFADTSGRVLEAIALSGKRLKGITRITASTTYNTPAGVTALLVRAVGGGGAGGSAGGGGSNYSIGGGGGAGAYGEVWVASPGASYAVTIGAAGSPAAAGNNAGGNGGATSFGSLLNLGGGNGGNGAAGGTFSVGVGGGVGGSVTTGGDRSHDGDKGGRGIQVSGAFRASGRGANSPFGSGADDRVISNTGTSNAGLAGSGYGAGGGGALAGTSSSQAGGAGTAGYVEVWEFVDW